MNNYVIITDSSCDLPASLADELGVKVLQLEVNIEGERTKFNNEIDIKDFYATLRTKKAVTTSAVNIDRFIDVFERELAGGNDILYIGFSSGLSSTYNAGKNAADELNEKYPDKKILTVDSLSASLGQGLLVTLAAKKRSEGATLEELCQYVEDTKWHLCHWFTVDDLFFLKRGGRVSAATAVLGTMLSIKPVLHMDNEGHLINVEKARGRQPAIKALLEHMKKLAIEPQKQTIYISHGDCYDEAKSLADMIKAEFGINDILISEVGPVIGAHSGPGTIALFFLGSER